eukprot:442038-Lingulodinium_polyedra.AAC.1
MVLAAMTFSNKQNQRLTRIIAYVAQASFTWHAEQNRLLRSAKGTMDWCRDMAEGSFFDHLNDTVSIMQDGQNMNK